MDIEIQTQTCNTCNLVKPLWDYSRKDGLTRPRCKACDKSIRKPTYHDTIAKNSSYMHNQPDCRKIRADYD